VRVAFSDGDAIDRGAPPSLALRTVICFKVRSSSPSSVLEPASPSQVWVFTARFVLSSSSQQPLPSRLASRFTSSRVACDGGT
jgi:hypothetical protein